LTRFLCISFLHPDPVPGFDFSQSQKSQERRDVAGLASFGGVVEIACAKGSERIALRPEADRAGLDTCCASFSSLALTGVRSRPPAPGLRLRLERAASKTARAVGCLSGRRQASRFPTG